MIKRDYKKEKNTHTHKKAFKTQKMIDTQTEKKRNNKNLLEKYLQVIELFKKTNLSRGTSIRHLLFFSKKGRTFSIFSSVFY